MVMWVLQLHIVIIALGMFYLNLGGRLARMPGGRFEHAWGVLLFLVPLFGPWYVKAWIILWWAIGWYAYADDLYQHWRRTWEPNYRSPLHLWGWYTLRPLLKRWKIWGK